MIVGQISGTKKRHLFAPPDLEGVVRHVLTGKSYRIVKLLATGKHHGDLITTSGVVSPMRVDLYEVVEIPE